MICIYHNRDLDGFTSGAIVKKWHDELNDYPDNVGKGELKLIGYDYGQPVPYDQIPTGETLIMIDVSLKMPDMLKLSEHLGSWKNFIWIDHHISAIKEYEAFMTEREEHYPFLTAVLENGIAACEVGWKYLFPNKQTPAAITLLGEYDTWRNSDEFRWHNHILPFQFGMRVHCNSPETFPTELLGNTVAHLAMIAPVIENGKCILSYQASVNETQCKKASFEIEFEGLKAICLNGGGFNSDVFKSVYDESKHDIMMPFQFDGKQWTISLYTTKDYIDCSQIAKSKGGGGHKKAAGFQVKEIGSVFPTLCPL